MTRISETFRRLMKKGGKAFIPYVMAGDPSLDKTVEMVHILEECGADIIELGVPFSDPLADGPTIQRASERALSNCVTLRKVISLVRDLRQSTQVPLVLMTYFNPVFKYGIEDFIGDARVAGVDGVIIPDLPPDEAEDFIRLSRKASLDTIFLLAPTSTEERIKKSRKGIERFHILCFDDRHHRSEPFTGWFDGNTDIIHQEIYGQTDSGRFRSIHSLTKHPRFQDSLTELSWAAPS